MTVPLYCPTAASTGCTFDLDSTNRTTLGYLAEHMRRMHPDVPYEPVNGVQVKKRQRSTLKLPKPEQRHRAIERNRERRREQQQPRTTRRKWNRELAVDAIQRWEAQHGEPPRTTQWQTKTQGFDHPVTQTLVQMFGTFNNAIKAAGLQPRTVGRPTKEGKPA